MKTIITWLVLLNLFLIPTGMIFTPLMIESIYTCHYEGIWQDECLKNKDRWSWVLFIVPIMGANIMAAFYITLYGIGLPTTPKTNDPYEGYTQEWKDFMQKKESIEKKNKEDSDLILKIYESMPDLTQQNKDNGMLK
jgi:hypothetical protein